MATVPNPSEYYTSKYSGEEIDNAIGQIVEIGALTAANIPMSDDDPTTVATELGNKAPAPLEHNLTLYVDAAAGNDSNPGTEAQPFATIQAALNSIPKNLGGNTAYINIAAGTYPDTVDIRGFYGANQSNTYGINVKGDAADTTFLTGGVAAFGCRVPITLTYLSISGNLSGNTLSARQCTYLDIGRCTVDGASTDNAVYFEATDASLFDISVSNARQIAICATQCTAYLNGLSGSGNPVGVQSGSNSSGRPGLCIVGINTMTADIKYQKARGGAIIENGVLV